MLGLGADITHGGLASAFQLVLYSTATTDVDDENVSVVFAVLSSDTAAALLSGITQGTGNKVNGTVELTVNNHDTLGSDVARAGTKIFNVFQFIGNNQAFYFLSTSTSNITISAASDYQVVDLTDATFLNSEGSDANLDAAGSGEVYDFQVILSIPGFEDSEAVVTNAISIDAA